VIIPVGSLVFTSFFGSHPKPAIILEVKSGLYGIRSYLTLLPDGQCVYLHPDEVCTPEEMEKS
jgi:hypothetical protein